MYDYHCQVNLESNSHECQWGIYDQSIIFKYEKP